MVTTNSNEIPPWAKNHLSADSKATVEAAVQRGERQTSGEIVPMVVRRSSVRGHVLPLTASLVLLVILELLFTFSPPWAHHAWWALLAAAVIAVLISPAVFLLRWLTPAKDLEAQVLQRAVVEFYHAGLNQTAGSTGILLFVSLAERRAVVLADKAIAAKLGPETWKTVVDQVIAGIKAGDLGRGLVSAIDDCAKILAAHFPVLPNDQNELGDGLIIKE